MDFTDIPQEIIQEIAGLVDPLDIITLRQVHRSLRNLPVQLTKDLPGLERIDQRIIQQYPSIYSFMGFGASPKDESSSTGACDMGMDWFFKLSRIYPGYNNIRRLEITLNGEVAGPLPAGLEWLHIRARRQYKCLEIFVDLSSLKRLQVLKCSDDGVVTFCNIPDGLLDIEVDVMNIPDWKNIPRGLRRLKVTNSVGYDYIPLKINFMEFPELEDLEVFIDLEEIELPAKLKRVSCTGFKGIDEVQVYSAVMERPDPSIPWDPRIHLIDLGCGTDLEAFTEFTGLDSLVIMTSTEGGNKLPRGLQKLTVISGGAPDFVGLHHLRHLSLQNVCMDDFFIEDLPAGITHLILDSVTFPKTTYLDFSSLPDLVCLSVNKTNTYFGKTEGLTFSCDLSENHKLEKLSLVGALVCELLPRSLVDIYMKSCDIEGQWWHLNKLRRLSLNLVRIADDRFPFNLETLSLVGVNYNEPSGFSFNFGSLKTLSLAGISLRGPLPDTITDLSITDKKQDLVLSHLNQLKSLTINSWIDDQIGEFIGPIPTSLRHLNLECCTNHFDLTDLLNLETLNIVRWNNKAEMGTLPPSIKLLITDTDFDITKINLPNLREHRQI